ncbi:GNAT family N-acetyltransferase [Arsenicicoccus bolidensis]|uniref:GNAT family N-acetyltransferase n=1 Tax=Arsenicicoccus bolidensis TaxID=229480 RepID=A0ABS9Q6C8_9MICO|nr:GNAT family N-acetyltransferase [Arsenicicoccus bolidensis]MCG7323433.1 GNAT family N-acetyltransferase [Arsenicicoccus bolidensis]
MTDNPAIVIRPRRDDDLDELARILVEVHAHDGYPVEGVDDPRAWLHLERPLGAWMAELDGQVVGHVALTQPGPQDHAPSMWADLTTKPKEETAVLGRLFISPGARGKRVGAELTRTAMRAAMSEGRTAVLDVMAKDKAARRVYETQNWQALGAVDHIHSGGIREPAFAYVAPLSSVDSTFKTDGAVVWGVLKRIGREVERTHETAPAILALYFHEQAEKAPDGGLWKLLFHTLEGATSAMLDPANWATPFSPAARFGDRRSILPQDLDEASFSALALIAPHLAWPRLAARVFDILWLYTTRNDELRSKAIDNYLAIDIEPSGWHNGVGEECGRAVAILIRGGKRLREQRMKMRDKLLIPFQEPDPLEVSFLLSVSRILRTSGIRTPADVTIMGQKCENLAADDAISQNPQAQQLCLREALAWIRLQDDRAEEDRLTAAIASALATQAEETRAQSEPFSLAESMILEESLREYSQVSIKYREEHGLDETIIKTRDKLSRARKRLLDNMQVLDSEPVEITELVRTAEAFISGQSGTEALIRFAHGIPLFNTTSALEAGRDWAASSLAYQLFGRLVIYHADGRRVSTRSPSSSPGDPAEDFSLMFQTYSTYVPLVTTAWIVPGLDVLGVEHFFDLETLHRLLLMCPEVPYDRSIAWTRGLMAGLNGDFGSALAILPPLIEHSIRLGLKTRDVYTLVSDADGNEAEKGMTALLKMPASRDMLGPKLHFELTALFGDPGGFNIRNEVAHGLASDSQTASPVGAYSWWMALRFATHSFALQYVGEQKGKARQAPSSRKKLE